MSTAPAGDGPDRHPLVESYLADLRRLRPAAVPRVAGDLDDFFTSMARRPLEVTVLDVLTYVTGRIHPNVDGVRLHDGQPVTLTGQLRNLSRFYTRLLLGEQQPDHGHPVPEALTDRRSRRRPADCRPPDAADPTAVGALPLGVGTLRRIHLVDASSARDRAILAAILYGGLHVGEVAGLRLDDLKAVDGVLFVTGRQGRRRIVPVVSSFFDDVEDYLADERPAGVDTPALFIACKGRRRGLPLGVQGIREVVVRSCVRSGRPIQSAGELRRAGLEGLRKAGMDGTALRAFAGQTLPSGLPLVSGSVLIDNYRRAARRLQLD